MELSKNDIEVIIVLMNRVNLTGSEVPKYVEIMSKLSDILEGGEDKVCIDTK